MWYKSGMGVGYAESGDGIKWTRPRLDLTLVDGEIVDPEGQVLGRHGGVGEAVVVLSGEQEQPRLMAYVKGKDGRGRITASELRQYLRGKLPEHMVPGSYREVERWPLLPSGKVDRRALAGGTGKALGEGEAHAGPRNEVERKLAEMWQELLKVERVGIDQNFFELGGHSLLALQVMARIRSQLGVELAVRSLFEGATIAELGVEVEKAEYWDSPSSKVVQLVGFAKALATGERLKNAGDHEKLSF